RETQPVPAYLHIPPAAGTRAFIAIVTTSRSPPVGDGEGVERGNRPIYFRTGTGMAVVNQNSRLYGLSSRATDDCISVKNSQLALAHASKTGETAPPAACTRCPHGPGDR